MKKEVKIPDIAENVETGIIAGVLVSQGDKVTKDQPLVEIETDKATTDIPSEYDGVVDEVKVSQGDEVKVNEVIMIIEVQDSSEGDKEDEQKEEKEKAEEERVEEEKEEKTEKKKEKSSKEDKQKKDESKEQDLGDVAASPSVRRIARELNVNIIHVEGTGPGGRITKDDVENYANQSEQKPKKTQQLPDFETWGSVSREKMSNIRKITATSLTEAWQTVPHVTQFDEADITNLENFRKQNQEKIEKKGGKLTVTSLLLKIVGLALQKFPQFNASIDFDNKEVIYKHYFNVGIAVDTEQGLLVPVVRDVNKKSLANLSAELSDLASKARNKKIAVEEMQGGNFTISNLGGIGGTGFTPIVYSPQVAILGISRSRYQQVYINDKFEKRLIIPLSLSYDHRLIDGADGARFLRWICDVIEDPYAILF